MHYLSRPLKRALVFCPNSSPRLLFCSSQNDEYIKAKSNKNKTNSYQQLLSSRHFKLQKRKKKGKNNYYFEKDLTHPFSFFFSSSSSSSGPSFFFLDFLFSFCYSR
jgi:hypothetical protein